MMSTTQQLSNSYGILAYREAGVQDARQSTPLVLLHGVGMQSAAWHPQLDTLAGARRVIALDLPGHGQSDRLPEGSSLSAFVEWLRAALDTLGLDRVSLAGHSMGALISGGFAVIHPNRLERVALLNGVFCRDAQARAAVVSRAKQIDTGAFDVETPLQRWFGETEAEQHARQQVSNWLSEVRMDGYATAYSAFANGDATYAPGFAKIPCPLLALTGRDDPNSTPAMSEAMAAAAPMGQSVIIENHRHMVNLTAPDAVNAALEEWLKTQSPEEHVA